LAVFKWIFAIAPCRRYWAIFKKYIFFVNNCALNGKKEKKGKNCQIGQVYGEEGG